MPTTSWNPSNYYFKFLSSSSIWTTVSEDFVFLLFLSNTDFGTLNFNLLLSKILLKLLSSFSILWVTSEADPLSVIVSRALWLFFSLIYFNFSYMIYRCFSWAYEQSVLSVLALKAGRLFFVSASSIEFSSEFGLPLMPIFDILSPYAFSFLKLKY